MFQTSAVRKTIHVGNRTFNDGSNVEKHLVQDVMKSVKPWIEALLDAGRYRDVRVRLTVFDIAFPCFNVLFYKRL